MRWVIAFMAVSIFLACSKPDISKRSVKMITSEAQQDSLFQNMLEVVNSSIDDDKLSDSLAFLLLPIDASCPACRNKTIDSILKYRHSLTTRHYIIVSSSSGKALIDAYFREQKGELPDIKGQIFIDTINKAYKLKLFNDNPTIYYAHDRKVYKKVSAIPITIRDDLREFFSGHRN